MPIATYYHYTADADSHVGSVLQQGVITTTESNISLQRTHLGPDVVWLLDRPMQAWEDHGLRYLIGSAKTAVEVAVDLPSEEVHDWRTWAQQHGSDPKTIALLTRTGGGRTQSRHWRVIERPILSAEWRHVRWTVSGRLLTPNPLTGCWCAPGTTPVVSGDAAGCRGRAAGAVCRPAADLRPTACSDDVSGAAPVADRH